MSLDESWQRYPEARIRMREQDLDILIGALQEHGICIAGQPTIRLLDDGILISLNTNSGKWGKLIALPIDVFIPCVVPQEQKEEEAVEPQPEPTPEAGT
jgi:hypothetical protein